MKELTVWAWIIVLLILFSPSLNALLLMIAFLLSPFVFLLILYILILIFPSFENSKFMKTVDKIISKL